MVWKAAGLALALSLLLPWFEGSDDGESLTVAGWDTEPGFTVGVLASAAGIALAKRPVVALVCAVAAIGLIVWMLPRGDRYSGYDLAPGGFVALALAVAVLASATRAGVRARPGGP